MPIIYGKNPVKELILSGKTINKVYLGKNLGGLTDIKNLAIENNIVVVNTDKNKLDSMCEGKNSQGVVASYTEYNYYEISDIIEYARSKNENPFVLVLDKIEDPHNLGAIIRSGECLGVHGIIIQKRNAVGVTDIVEKTAAGATSYMRVARVTNITRALEELKKEGLWIYGLDMEGATEIYKTDLRGNIGLVIGNEGEGISRLVRENCDGIIKIPMYGNIDSLNASASAAITMYEVVRQNRGTQS